MFSDLTALELHVCINRLNTRYMKALIHCEHTKLFYAQLQLVSEKCLVAWLKFGHVSTEIMCRIQHLYPFAFTTLATQSIERSHTHGISPHAAIQLVFFEYIDQLETETAFLCKQYQHIFREDR